MSALIASLFAISTAYLAIRLYVEKRDNAQQMRDRAHKYAESLEKAIEAADKVPKYTHIQPFNTKSVEYVKALASVCEFAQFHFALYDLEQKLVGELMTGKDLERKSGMLAGIRAVKQIVDEAYLVAQKYKAVE